MFNSYRLMRQRWGNEAPVHAIPQNRRAAEEACCGSAILWKRRPAETTCRKNDVLKKRRPAEPPCRGNRVCAFPTFGTPQTLEKRTLGVWPGPRSPDPAARLPLASGPFAVFSL